MWLHVLLFAPDRRPRRRSSARCITLAFAQRLRHARRCRSTGALLLHGLLVQRARSSGSSAATSWGTTSRCRVLRRRRVAAVLPSVAARCLTGTLGAVIRIREPIPDKRVLFDIGIAGPIAGFVVAVPALFIGMALSHVVAVPAADGRLDARRAAALQAGVVARVRHASRTATRSTCTRWRSPRGSACWRRR